MINFLGRGAFGEVYEGKARIGENGSEIKVAVKVITIGHKLIIFEKHVLLFKKQ